MTGLHLEGLYNLSDNREVLGVSPGTYKRDGAFAEFIAIPSIFFTKFLTRSHLNRPQW